MSYLNESAVVARAVAAASGVAARHGLRWEAAVVIGDANNGAAASRSARLGRGRAASELLRYGLRMPNRGSRHALFASATAALAFICVASALAQTTPILAGPWVSHQSGYGRSRPSRIFNGGDPTGLVTRIHWTSWGGARAIGTGTSDYVGPTQSVATGTQESARVVAFHLGSCHGRRAYDAIEWYFPQHGDRFSGGNYIDPCTGTYYQDGKPQP